MRAAVPVLLLVALAGCRSVFCVSLDVAAKEDGSDERVEISDLQKSDETKSEAESEEERMAHDNCFGKAVRDQPEQKFNPTVSSVSEEITRGSETQNTTETKTEDEGTEARAEVQALSLDMAEEDSDEERSDIKLLKRLAGDTSVAEE
ncbi:uncharacterized protein LOC108276731 isoform X1 [Ictalurus punctatus]|uniref:Uncharacterized protein LOC108276731 isoform X1 n=1 Tax=Ictalurus punctatus TaxID=7998 RepID=A0A9F7TRR0_ICTPU|nr:uncharacterized protein LOC108276731 isoform X1 [Ictalurus punctatus]